MKKFKKRRTRKIGDLMIGTRTFRCTSRLIAIPYSPHQNTLAANTKSNTLTTPSPFTSPCKLSVPKPLSDCLNRGFAIALAIRLLDLIEFDQSSSMQPVSVA